MLLCLVSGYANTKLMEITKYERVLCLSPHTDDIEIGCGATLAKLSESGTEIMSIAFSAAEESVPDGFSKDILRKEFKNSHYKLGINLDKCDVLNFKVRRFPEQRQEILEQLVTINREFKPDLVLTTSSLDNHQDHKTIAEESFRAFKRTSILAYDIPWNQRITAHDLYIAVSKKELDKKIEAIKEYKSQKFRGYVDKEFVISLARVRGSVIGEEFAEAFEVIRLVQR